MRRGSVKIEHARVLVLYSRWWAPRKSKTREHRAGSHRALGTRVQESHKRMGPGKVEGREESHSCLGFPQSQGVGSDSYEAHPEVFAATVRERKKPTG